VCADERGRADERASKGECKRVRMHAERQTSKQHASRDCLRVCDIVCVGAYGEYL